MTLIVVRLSSRKLRVGVIALALIAALSTHWANAAMNIKLHQVVHHRPMAAKQQPTEVPVSPPS